MNLIKSIKKYLPLIVMIIGIGLILSLWILYIPIMRRPPIPGERKALILCSANDFYRKDEIPDFNNGRDALFDNESGSRWISNFTNGYGAIDNTIPGYSTPGVMQLISFSWGGYVNLEYIFNWTDYYPLMKYAAYNLSAWVNITKNDWSPATIIPTGAGARIGFVNTPRGL